MREKKIADLFRVRSRFLRSANLERDFGDPGALSHYVVTDFARSCLGRMATGLKPRSGNRAWRMTGDYGSGKSSFALMLAHWFAGNDSAFPSHVRRSMEPQHFGVARPRFVPVLVTCSRQPLALSILRSLLGVLDHNQGRGPKPRVYGEIQQLIDSKNEPTDEDLFSAIRQVNAKFISDSKSKGLLLILDELGKFLEFAALHPERQDIFLLQRLAETAARSGDEPLFVVSLLHQGFNAYADQLNQSSQREWEKVAGRFEEIVFNPPFEQAATIVAAAMDVHTQQLPKHHAFQLRDAMMRTHRLGWLGAASANGVAEHAARLYPLHPTVLPVLIRTFRRFGQNERSLFSFLLSNEPFGLQAFAQKPLGSGELYRLHHLYDYVRTNFGHRLSVQSYRSHWNLIDSVVESFSEESEAQIKVLKTVGILNLLNESDLLATEDAIACALAGDEQLTEKSARAALHSLHREKRIIYDRGRARGLCLWPHSSVDIEKAYEDACRVVDTPKQVGSLIGDFLDPRPIVGRRHYIETGNLRHADVRYCPVTELAANFKRHDRDADGLILVPLCETLSQRDEAIAFCKREEVASHESCLIAVPQPLHTLAPLVQELQRWEWVSANTLELNGDKYAREEVSRQKLAAKSQLEKRIQNYIGWQTHGGQMTLEWYRQGRKLRIRNGRNLLETLSTMFDLAYKLAPKVHNELVNRRSLSSAAAAARMRLIERMFTEPQSPWLGMNPDKKPPEMSMYLSVLKGTGLHRQHNGTWQIGEPSAKDDRCNILPALRRIGELVREKPDSRISVATLCNELRDPPYGVRDGLIPLLLSAFAIGNERDVAIYKDGSFVREMDGQQMLILTKAPERFEIQYCRIEGVRAELFTRLVTILEIPAAADRELELLDVVRNLCLFVAGLPAYVRLTKRLSATALAVRDAILDAREPAPLLFFELPKACGFEPISAGSNRNAAVKEYVKTLRGALDELKIAFAQLQDRLRKGLRDEFGLTGAFEDCRSALIDRARTVSLGATEAKFKAFCLRLIDTKLSEPDWLESVGSHVGLKPPSKWSDADEDLYHGELAHMAALFKRVESIAFSVHGTRGGSAIRVSVTAATGVEHQQVIHLSTEEEIAMSDLESTFSNLLSKHGQVGLAAASRAIWARFETADGRKRHG
ncbi:MAG: hypothetical protein J0H49_02960 [Acidobacteria bacterium]|nr:hypothetical protein [Acidobacteriota bacterium]